MPLAHTICSARSSALFVQPTLELPIDGMGEGLIHVVQVPVDAELSEKIWGPLCKSDHAHGRCSTSVRSSFCAPGCGPEQPLVHPGGIRLGPIDVADQALYYAYLAGVGRRWRANPSRHLYGRAQPRLGRPDAHRPAEHCRYGRWRPGAGNLPAGVTEDTYDVILTSAKTMPSDAVTLTVFEATRPSVDAPRICVTRA